MRWASVRSGCQQGLSVQKRKGRPQGSNYLRISWPYCSLAIWKAVSFVRHWSTSLQAQEPGKSVVRLVCLCSGGSVLGHELQEKWWTGSRKTFAQKLSATAEGRTLHTWHCCWLEQATWLISLRREGSCHPTPRLWYSWWIRGSYPHVRSCTWKRHLMWCSVLWTILSWA